MTDTKQFKKTSYSVEPGLAKEFAIECLRRDVTQSEALTQAIHLWLKTGTRSSV